MDMDTDTGSLLLGLASPTVQPYVFFPSSLTIYFSRTISCHLSFLFDHQQHWMHCNSIAEISSNADPSPFLFFLPFPFLPLISSLPSFFFPFQPSLLIYSPLISSPSLQCLTFSPLSSYVFVLAWHCILLVSTGRTQESTGNTQSSTIPTRVQRRSSLSILSITSI